MTQEEKLKYLKIALNVIGVLFIAGLPAMMMWIWPSGWGWTPPQPEYEHMILGVYGTLGVFLIMAAKDPLANTSLIWFTIWSSIVHGGIMLIHALIDETDRRCAGALSLCIRSLVSHAQTDSAIIVAAAHNRFPVK